MTETQPSNMDTHFGVTDDPCTMPWYSDSDEPTVDVPAGLLGQAIELLDLCDELINKPGHDTIDTQIRTVINRYQRTGAGTQRWFQDNLGTTAADLLEILDGTGIIVEPKIRCRPRHH